MRVTIAGPGTIAKYFIEELVPAGIEVTILTRSIKPEYENYTGVKQFVTDYSVSSIAQGLEGSSALLSTILDYTPANIDLHLRLMEACKQSSTCKRFIPSEWGSNVEDFPDQPGFYYRSHEPIRQALRDQSELEWTIVNLGWIADYIVPSKNRYFKDIDDAFPVNFKTEKIIIPGTGKEPIDFTSAKDLAKAVVKLVQAPKWEQYTWVSGEKSCWNDVAKLMLERYPGMTVEYKSLYQLVEEIRTAKNEEERGLAEFQILGPSHAGSLNADKVAEHRQTLFQGIKFRTLRELLEEVDRNPDVIV
ncbi:NAD(P)-binding protein [Corynespora cassiicola Philippines]|uniref:NAD(P)-binding protein n=1 Tax=Corynespora cassiicola Philippines TaxID=1448308 RepID=A0A2T2NX22_CORCC|nr:NAD(P)-binding protein [Corynespora cassiicola Philippines]